MGAIEQKIQDKSQKINAKHEQIQETAKKGLDKIVDKIKSQSEMARCNKVGIVCHTIVSAAIGVAYLAEFARGSRTLLYVLLTIVIGIASPVAEWIVYKKDDKIVNLNVNTMGTELEFTMNEDNRLVTEDIYKEVANIICVYYKNTEDACRSTLSKVDENNPINGIRYVTSDNNILVYVNTAKSIDIENIDTYTEVTKTELSKTNYELKLDTETINNIKITNADTLITFTGNVTTTSESKNMSIVVTLYGDNDTKLTEEKYEFNDTNKLEENKEFKVEFTLNDTLNLDSIKAYSISIEK